MSTDLTIAENKQTKKKKKKKELATKSKTTYYRKTHESNPF